MQYSIFYVLSMETFEQVYEIGPGEMWTPVSKMREVCHGEIYSLVTYSLLHPTCIHLHCSYLVKTTQKDNTKTQID